MLTAANLVAFVAVTDLDRARSFYEGTLALTLVTGSESALVFETRGTELRVTAVDEVTPSDHTVLGFDVADATRTATKLRDAGVELARFDSLDQDDLGIWTAPDGTRIAWFRDPDGNLLAIAQS